MFGKAAIVAVTLAIVLAGSPVGGEAKSTNGIRVPLHTPRSLRAPDGTFDHAKAIRELVKTRNKHRQNLINLERNVGRQAFPEGAEIMPLTTVPMRYQKRDAEGLTDQENDLEWTGNVTVGTPGKSFIIDFDTGSSDFWVPSSSCKNCGDKALYNHTESSTSSAKNGTFSIHYGDNSFASGTPYTDTVTAGGITVTKQYFAAVTTLSSELRTDVADGIMGLAFPQLASLEQDPFFTSAIKQGAVKNQEFGFKLAQFGSELFLGGINSELFSGPVEFHSLSSDSGFWQIGGASALINGQPAAEAFDTVIDSGSTIMTAPTEAAKAFWDMIDGSKVFDQDEGLYSFPCANPPNIEFTWGGKSWAISPDNFNLGETVIGSEQCVGALAGGELGLGPTTWLLGDSFMKNVYSVFSVDQKAVGFASLVTLA